MLYDALGLHSPENSNMAVALSVLGPTTPVALRTKENKGKNDGSKGKASSRGDISEGEPEGAPAEPSLIAGDYKAVESGPQGLGNYR